MKFIEEGELKVTPNRKYVTKLKIEICFKNRCFLIFYFLSTHENTVLLKHFLQIVYFFFKLDDRFKVQEFHKRRGIKNHI